MKKSTIGLTFLVLAFALGVTFMGQKDQGKTASKKIVIYQSKSCGCCKKWVKHLEDNGFETVSKFVDDVTETKLSVNLPMKLASCHTALVDGYLIEGHVPASAIQKLLAEKSSIKGIAVPGMPMGSPGMEGSYKEPFDVIAFEENGNERIFMNF